MDPLSIATAVITFYATLYRLKKLASSLSDEVVQSLARDCDYTLAVILHTKYRLDIHDRYAAPDDVFNPIDVRGRLRELIAHLHPDIATLKQELSAMLSPAETNYDHLRKAAVKPHHLRRLKKLHQRILQSRQHFDMLVRSVEGENADWMRRHHVGDPPSSRRPSAGSAFSMPSIEPTRSDGSDDLTLVATRETVQSEEGTEILLDALRAGRRKDVQTLLRTLGVDPNVADRATGSFPLHAAVESGDLAAMEDLLRCGAAPNAVDKQGDTALHVATRLDNGPAVALLLRCGGADPNREDADGRTPLWHAAYRGSFGAMEALLDGATADVVNHRCRDPKMPTALWAAAAVQSLSAAEDLLYAGADGTVADARGATLLHKSAWPGAAALAPLLLLHRRCDAALWARDERGKLPLHCAAAAGKADLVDVLLGRMGAAAAVDNDGRGTAVVDVQDGEGATPLIRAAQKGRLSVAVRLCGRWGARWDVRDRVVGADALYYACANGHALLAAYLMGRGADVNGETREGQTPLHTAARWGQKEVVRLLLQAGADRTAVARQMAPADARNQGCGVGKTAADLAREAGYQEVAQMIDGFLEDDGGP